MLHLVTVAAVRAAYVTPQASLDVTDDAQTERWAQRLSVSADALREAVAAVGPSLAAVRRHLAH